MPNLPRRRIRPHQMRKRRLELGVAPHQRIVLGVGDLRCVLGMIQPVMPRDLAREPHQLVGGFGLGKLPHQESMTGRVSIRIPNPAISGRALAIVAWTWGKPRLSS